MESVSRKVVYRMYPTCRQNAALFAMLGLHQRLYNAALEQRIAAWRRTRTSLGFVDQCLGSHRASRGRQVIRRPKRAVVAGHFEATRPRVCGLLPTRESWSNARLKPSQRCSNCCQVAKKTLSDGCTIASAVAC